MGRNHGVASARSAAEGDGECGTLRGGAQGTPQHRALHPRGHQLPGMLQEAGLALPLRGHPSGSPFSVACLMCACRAHMTGYCMPVHTSCRECYQLQGMLPKLGLQNMLQDPVLSVALGDQPYDFGACTSWLHLCRSACMHQMLQTTAAGVIDRILRSKQRHLLSCVLGMS